MDELDRLSVLANAEKDTSVIRKNSSSFCGSRVSADINSNKVDFHHFTVATVICPHHSRSQWCTLHKEDDVMVKREGVAPTVRASQMMHESFIYDLQYVHIHHSCATPTLTSFSIFLQRNVIARLCDFTGYRIGHRSARKFSSILHGCHVIPSLSLFIRHVLHAFSAVTSESTSFIGFRIFNI